LSRLDALINSVGFYAEMNAIAGPYTFFAPSNAAINAAAASLPNNPEAVRAILRRHISVTGRYGSLELFALPNITMLSGDTLQIDGTARTVGGRQLIVVDKGGAATNQVLHVINGMLLP
jgi:uncharacterized surface protein with fasciclin (FAS1) repeats